MIKIIAWLILFSASSFFLENYEALSNSGNLYASGTVTLTAQRTTGLMSEGIIGYMGLGLICASVFMFCFEWHKFSRALCSLSTSENFSARPEVKTIV